MKIWLTTLFLSCITLLGSDKNIYNYSVKDINENDFDMSSLKGKKVMIVNTASKCGLTPQYEKLQALYEKYGGDGFVIIGFPSNDFMSQEPGNNSEIAEFCQKNYGVTFPMMSKVNVKGKDIAPLFKYLTDKNMNGVSNESVSWNFQKFLINESGELVKVFSPRTSPDDPAIIEWIVAK